MKLPESLFVSAAPIAKSVLFDGVEHTLYFRELPAVEFRKQHLAETSNDERKKAAALGRLLAAGLCDEEGKPVMTEAQACQLKPLASSKLLQLLMEVNRVGGTHDADEKNA